MYILDTLEMAEGNIGKLQGITHPCDFTSWLILSSSTG
jgi:hypothetical protein